MFGDSSVEIARTAISSDLLVLVTTVTFGGYSYEIKKVLDRIVLAMLLPFFTKIEGEFHHPARYPTLPELVVVGTLATADADAQSVFEAMVGRNARNLHSTHAAVAVVVGDPTTRRVAAIVDDLLVRAEAASSPGSTMAARQTETRFPPASATREVA